MPCLWRKTASFPAKPVERRKHPTLSPHLLSPTAPSLEAVRHTKNKREWESRTVDRGRWSWCFPCVVWKLSPRREHLRKRLKPEKEWAIYPWKRSVFPGNHREKGSALCLGSVWRFQGNVQGPMWSEHLRGEEGKWGSFSQTFLFFTLAASTSR